MILLVAVLIISGCSSIDNNTYCEESKDCGVYCFSECKADSWIENQEECSTEGKDRRIPRCMCIDNKCSEI